jgi:hypothetical protein
MQQSASQKANPKVYYCIYKSPPLHPILSRMNAVCTLTAYIFCIHIDIVMGVASPGLCTPLLQLKYQNPLMWNFLTAQLMSKAEVIPELSRNFPKGDVPIKVAIKSCENPVQFRADEKLV